MAGDLKTLCMDTHAAPAAVYAAADKAGWSSQPQLAGLFTKLSGEATGRVRGNPGAGEPTSVVTAAARPLANGVPDNRCIILAPTGFDAAVAGVGDLLGLPPSTQAPNRAVWNLSALDGVLRRSEDYKPRELFQPGRHGPLQTISVIGDQGRVVVAYRELGADRVIPPPPPLPADAGDVAHFKAWIEQDGRRQPLAGEVHLKKAPFVIVFEGSHVFSYSVAASLDPAALAGRTSEVDLEGVFNPLNVGAEGDRDHDLVVNPSQDGAPRPRPLTVHSWFEGEAGHQRFTSFAKGADGVATARRDITDLFIAHSGHDTPVATWDGRTIYLLVTACPPIAGRPLRDPKTAVLVFQ